VGTVITAFGCTLAVIYANHTDTSYSFQELVLFFANPTYLIYFTIVICYMFAANQYIEKLDQRDSERDPMETEKTTPQDAREKTIVGFLYASTGGIAGSLSVTFAKAFVELIKSSVEGKNEFCSPGPYVVTVFLICFSIFQVHYLNKGLELFDALYIVPIYQTFWIIGNVIAGIVYFQEWKEFTGTEIIMFPVGILVTLAGVAVLSARGKPGQEIVGVDEGDVEERKGLVEGGRNSVEHHRDTLGKDDHLKHQENGEENAQSWGRTTI